MPLAVNHGGNLRRQFLNKQLGTTVVGGACDLTLEQKERAKKWITRYRRNWDLFATEVLQMKLYPLQLFSLHMMGISQEYNEIATRGAAKSWRVGLGAIIAFCLYPYSEIVITSSTIPQAARLVEKKIRDEIIKKLSPYLLYMYEHEYIVITKSNTSEGGAYLIENKLNGSTIIVAPCLESARGLRSTFNIYEECRLLKSTIVSSVFEPMGHARQAKYLLNPKYNIPRWQEKARSFYITSARYSYEWFWRKYKDTVTNYYISKHGKYTPFAQDIFTAIEDGSRTWDDYRKNKKSMSELDFHMEILNEMFSEGEDAYFDLKEFRNNQELVECFRPPTIQDIFADKQLSMAHKAPDEIRLVVADFAFSGNNSREKNDNTVIKCMSLHWKKFRFERHLDYIETRPGGDASSLVLRLKELFWDYQADYLVEDHRSGGEVIYDYLSMKTPHPERGAGWNDSGFTVVSDMSLHVVGAGKIEELRNRTVDKNAVPCVIPFIGTSETNSLAWQSLKKQLEVNNIKFLISEQEYQDYLEDSGEYFELTAEEFAQKMLPYIQTGEVIHECVNLSAEYRNGLVRLSEPRSSYKDRAVCLAYGNYIAEKLDNKYNRQNQSQDFDISEIQLVF